MQVILLEKVGDLGNLGDILEVKNGYARNYLIPTGKAKRASQENIADFEQRKAELIAKQEAVIKEAQEKQNKVDGQTYKIQQKSGIDGRLFGSVTTIDIAKVLNELGVPTERSSIRLPHGPLKTVGEYDIEIAYHHDAVAVIKLIVEPQVD
ncbi:MAG: 50S ribosomal protein L9 [Neisseriaceae bacterium]|nr:50S ribosomal protein L9 [Neisseriaceae bacterium PsAf]MCV2509098.1 50S ribosomal protein L9 [Neisseriaceae bacterium]